MLPFENLRVNWLSTSGFGSQKVFSEQKLSIDLLKEFQVLEKGIYKYRLWQKGRGFDRNLWNAMAIHQSIEYIEANSVRRKLAATPGSIHGLRQLRGSGPFVN